MSRKSRYAPGLAVLQRFFLLITALFLMTSCSSSPGLDSSEPRGFQPFYQPQESETLAQVARRYPVSEEALRRFNPRSQEVPLNPERKLRLPERNADVPASGPYFYRIQRGDTLSSLAQHFHIALLSLQQANPGIQPKTLRIGQRLVIPVAGKARQKYRWPVQNPQIGLGFSQQSWGRHQGLALKTASREEIFPIAPGRVVFAGEMRGFGRVVILEHPGQHQSIYAYCHALFVEEGHRLSGRHPVCAAGEQRQLGRAGIYLELREQGQPVAPKNYLPALPWP